MNVIGSVGVGWHVVATENNLSIDAAVQLSDYENIIYWWCDDANAKHQGTFLCPSPPFCEPVIITSQHETVRTLS